MSVETAILLTAGVLVVAFLYSTVGHGGGSGYIAVMAIAGLAPPIIKPTALFLNILVASIGTWQFYRAGYFSWRTFWPFAALAVPGAFVGGYLQLPARPLAILIGCVLLYSAVRFFIPVGVEREPQLPPLAASLGTGAVLGFTSGLVGVGGGIFLTPLLILLRWARTRTASAVSAAFILVNSIAGLAGSFAGTGSIPRGVVPLAAAVIVGGVAGSYLGSRRLSVPVIRKLLAFVLLVAAGKLLFV